MSRIVRSNKIFTAKEYLKLVTGKDYDLNSDENEVAQVESILEQEEIYLWSFPLNEIDEILDHDNAVILVKFKIGNDIEFRWSEIPGVIKFISQHF